MGKKPHFTFETGQYTDQPLSGGHQQVYKATLPYAVQGCCGFQFTWDTILGQQLIPQMPQYPQSIQNWIQVIQGMRISGNQIQGQFVNIDVLDIGNYQWKNMLAGTQCP